MAKKPRVLRKPHGRVIPGSRKEGLSAIYPDQVRSTRDGIDWKNRALKRIQARALRMRRQTRAAMQARIKKGKPIEGLIEREEAIDEKERRLVEPLKESIGEHSTHHMRLLNQSTFREYLAKRLRSEAAHSVVFLDIDKFKQINRRFKHSTGDRMLALFSRALRNSFGVTGSWPRRIELASRYGTGDEFALYMPVTANKAREKIARINQIFRKYQRKDSKLPTPLRKKPVSLSAGVAYHKGAGWTVEDSVDKADTLMGIAKTHGGAGVAGFGKGRTFYRFHN